MIDPIELIRLQHLLAPSNGDDIMEYDEDEYDNPLPFGFNGLGNRLCIIAVWIVAAGVIALVIWNFTKP